MILPNNSRMMLLSVVFVLPATVTLSALLFVTECSTTEPLSQLPNSTICQLNKDCNQVECCVHSSTLARQLTFTFQYDACNHGIQLEVENYKWSHSLLDFEYGKDLNLIHTFIQKL